jgi:hypothetical protein
VARTATAWALTLLVWIAAPAAVAASWSRDRLLETDGWVVLAERLPEDAAVRTALGAELSTVVVDALGIRREGVRRRLDGVLREISEGILASEPFAVVWAEANRRLHRQAIAVLRSEADEDVRLDLRGGIGVLLDLAEDRIEAVVPLPGDPPELGPAPSLAEAEAAARQALGRPIAEGKATVVVLPAERLGAARTAFRGVERWGLPLVLGTLALAAAAVAVAPRRWRTAAALGIGAVVSMLVAWIAAAAIGSVLGSFVGPGIGREVVEAAARIAAEDLGGRLGVAAGVVGGLGVVAAVRARRR